MAIQSATKKLQLWDRQSEFVISYSTLTYLRRIGQALPSFASGYNRASRISSSRYHPHSPPQPAMSLAKSIPSTVREIRLHLCQTSPASQGVRYVLHIPSLPCPRLTAVFYMVPIPSGFRPFPLPRAPTDPRRQFIQSSYPSIKSAHPGLKFMIREASGVEPRAFVRFGESASSLPLTSLGIDSLRKVGSS